MKRLTFFLLATALATQVQATPRKPLVIVNGQVGQLQPGDTIADQSGAGVLSPMQFGAYCDNGVHDDAAAFQAMFNAVGAAGARIELPAGKQCALFSGVTISNPVTIEGPAGQIQSGGTAYAGIVAVMATGDVFTITTSQAVTFRNFGIRAGVVRTSGYDFKLVGDGVNLPIGARWDNITFNSSYNAIEIVNGNHWSITNCIFANFGRSGGGDAIYYPSNAYPDAGDNYITGNTFVSNPTGTANHGHSALTFESAGGLMILGNKFFGADYGIQANIKGVTGNPIITGNSFEQQAKSHIDVRQNAAGVGGLGNIVITSNEFSVLDSVANPVTPTAPGIAFNAGVASSFVKNVVISGNVFNDGYTAAVSSIALGDGIGMVVQGNSFNFYNGGELGAIETSGYAANVSLLDNKFNAMTTAQHYAGGLNGSTTVRDDNRIGLSPVVTWSGSAQGSAALSPLWVQETLGGTSTATAGSYLWGHQINLTDNLNAGDSTTMLDGLNIQDVIGASAKGSRNVLHPAAIVMTKPTDADVGTSYPAYVGEFPTAYGSVNLGGSGVTYATAGGGLWASNPNVIAASGATNLYGIIGQEIDVTAKTGSSMAQKFGQTIVQGATSVVSGAQDDAALAIINQPGAVGWGAGIQFGDTAANWPIASGGSLIAAVPGLSGAGNATATYGINFGAATFATSSVQVPGLVIDKNGHIDTTGGTVPSATVPTLSSCGTSPAIVGSDTTGTVTLGSGGPTACTITFGKSWVAAPHCILTARGTAAPGALAVTADSTTAITVGAVSMPSFTYLCSE